MAAKGYKFTALKPVHIEPLGLYAKKVKTLAEGGLRGRLVLVP